MAHLAQLASAIGIDVRSGANPAAGRMRIQLDDTGVLILCSPRA